MTERREQNPITISIRVDRTQRDLIDQAAEHVGHSRERFMLDAACREAEDVLLDQVFFLVDNRVFAQFQALLDSPSSPPDALRQLLSTRAPWE